MRTSVLAAERPSGRIRETTREFAEEVKRDLSLTPKQLQSKYLYDALGSCLFEAICRLPWYRITRAENRLLARHSRALVSALSDPLAIVELGCGSGEKLALLAEGVRSSRPQVQVHLIDISPMALDLSARTLGRFEQVSVLAHRATYEVGLRQVAHLRKPQQTLLVLLLGSNIGNFDPPGAAEFLDRIRQALQPGDALLLGADLTKPEAELQRAYDDPLGVTAAFNKNLLARINAELGADFRLDQFDHRAVWNPGASRVEMHLVSRSAQHVHIEAADWTVAFAEGEGIWTESSYKYEPAEIISMGDMAAFIAREQWIEPDARFALTLFEAG